MEYIKNFFVRYWPTVSLFVIGIILILYIAFGFVFFQQGQLQNDFQDKITQFSAVVARPLADITELQNENNKILEALAYKEPRALIKTLVEIADKSGIDISEEAGKFIVPSAGPPGSVKIGNNSYRTTSFNNIQVQGSPDAVHAFLADLDSGTTMPNMELTKITFGADVTIPYLGEEGIRRTEFRDVQNAVTAMMADNGLTIIPDPLNFAAGHAYNYMGDDPTTGGTKEGFPDVNTLAVNKGYTGSASPRDGYVLYGHDRISRDDPSSYETINYLPVLTTVHYYTCEEDGTVRQWDGPNLSTANELIGSEAGFIEQKVLVNVVIYSVAD